MADRDEAATTVERIGGLVLASSAGDWSRDALLRDPQGAEFSVSQFTPPQ